MDFKCLEGCGFCCTFPAEVRECEPGFNAILKIDRNGVKKWVTTDPYFCNVYTMRQHQERGACIFLREDRRCGIYPVRSLLCRIFPIKIFFGQRIQLYTSQVCRGFSQDSNSNVLCLKGKEIMEQLPAQMKEEMTLKAREMYDSLPGKLSDCISPSVLQTRSLEHVNCMDISNEIVTQRDKDDFTSQLSSEEFINLPTYLTADMQWLVFRLNGRLLERIKLERTGEIETTGNIDYSFLSLRPLSADAANALRKYLEIIVKRDHFAGVIYLHALEQERNVPLIDLVTTYIDGIAASLLLRANLLAAFEGHDIIDADVIKEAIIFSDGYLATEPSYGLIL
ncbi:MAG: YkgJ family cysteine cluster protein [Methanolobus sp.]|uniref:YkgJ family cysteine cluster protein n=1 Tax=Methanolobus sp. TaxID=1874737 RepID=UPI0027318DD5|nr:YkgJ family cysteine cluster protein [Methanolobus sp.]MDP2217052.1 YkgJ family cysteine cluster protein [Methanolobus sp.]